MALELVHESPAERRARIGEGIQKWPQGDGRIDRFMGEPAPDREWFVKERLLAGRAALLTGLGGSYKTSLMYHLAFAGVIGRLPWDWEVGGTGKALLFLTEDTAEDAHEMLQRFAPELSPEEQTLLRENLRIWPMAGEDCRVLVVGPGGIGINANGYGLIELVKSFANVRFIGLDPALGLSAGDELNQGHQRFLGQFVDRLAIETGACAMLVSHAAKGLGSAETLNSHMSRGGGAITDAVRAEIAVRAMTPKEALAFGIADEAEAARHIQVKLTKANKAPPSARAPLWLRITDGGLLAPAGLVAAEPSAVRLTVADEKAMEVLRELCRVASPASHEWRSACRDRGLFSGTDEAVKKAHDRTKARLLALGLIARGVGRGVFIPAEEE
ncbi:MAG: AAA family ATPase [Pseudomonadales bacterium]|nr:AAA family ATPase [Pseudomonadales bacterium]